MDSPESLQGRVAVVTGVGRRRGIGFAIARALAERGASLLVQHWRPHDEQQPWGADDPATVVGELASSLRGDARVVDMSLDLGDERAPAALVEYGVAEFGHVDVLVCNHAVSGSDGPLDAVDAAELDLHWRVNTRATLLATRAFARQHDGREGGRVVWMTSGQQLGPMPDEIAYATSKAALAGITQSVAADLAERAILLNTVNPGPVNTGFLDPEHIDPGLREGLLAAFPQERFGEPVDVARLVAWLVSDEGRWIVGQVLNSEGGLRRG
ncbi:SDR family oxidoreductase [Epidermidibacterium keratini]|uniref:SDR family oxidoreductase n=1 Tax=Epidermidibacterium keratini TaxID=1891644 RepID=A0A7L4YQU0_9ACTN|nr:SDR family oxidoreductase [Epidermidibacterium keratini]QHC01303.1 SDR family oxidoreductase [Epidermidibacterium keratini]